MITIVSGLGRCGSSLCMQMLNAAGMDCAGSYPSFEHESSKITIFNPQWLLEQKGKAVKVLGLNYIEALPGSYRTIYLTRNSKEQAKSQNKFSRMMSGISTNNKKALEKSMKQHNRECLYAAKKLGPVLQLKFEDFQNNPVMQISRIIEFIGKEDEAEDIADPMFKCIIKRPVKCQKDLRLEAYLCGLH